MSDEMSFERYLLVFPPDAMLRLLSEHVYCDPLAFVRELVTNGIDAVLPVPGASVEVAVEQEQGETFLVVTDTGEGLGASALGREIGRVGQSPRAGADLIGQFGVGLLAARMGGDRFHLVSRPQEGAGLEVIWDGGPSMLHRPSDVRATRGTQVKLRMKDAYLLDDLLPWMQRTFRLAKVPITLKVGGRSHRIDAPPPSGGSSLKTWWLTDLLGFGLQPGSRHVVLTPKERGFCALGLPEADTVFSEAFFLCRRGVRIPFPPRGLVPPELSWLQILVEDPDVEVVLSRETLADRSKEGFALRWVTPLWEAALRLLDQGLPDCSMTTWWERHHSCVLALLGNAPGSSSKQCSEVGYRKYLFESEAGLTSLEQMGEPIEGRLKANARALNTQFSPKMLLWRSAMERSLCMRWAKSKGKHVTSFDPDMSHPLSSNTSPRSAGKGVPQGVRAVAEVLKDFGVEVSLNERVQGQPHDRLATWRNPPPWISSSLTLSGGSLLLDWAASEVSALGNALPVLPWPLRRAIALLFMELAGADRIRPHEVATQEGAAQIQELIRSALKLPPGKAASSTCYIAYDWRKQQPLFAALEEALKGIDIVAVAPYHVHHASYILPNIVHTIRNCNAYITLLTSAHDAVQTPSAQEPTSGDRCPPRKTPNPNLVMELGIGMAWHDARLQMVCIQEDDRELFGQISNLQGYIVIFYTDERDLKTKVLAEFKKQGDPSAKSW